MSLKLKNCLLLCTLISTLLGCSTASSQTSQFASDREVSGNIGELHLNQLQYIGTHNSYHIAPNGALKTLIRLLDYKESKSWPASKLLPALDFTHIPISTQLELGMRQFELDIHYDPKGGKFSNPGALRVLQSSDVPSSINYDPNGDLRKPGFKVFHGGIDVESTCLLLKKCLTEIKTWSDSNPGHFPIIIQIEAKEGQKRALAEAYKPIPEPNFGLKAWQDLEGEILTVFKKSQIITPQDIQGSHRNLNKAIREDGWPKLKDISGKVMFLLLNKKKPTNRYEKARPDLKHKLFFTSVGEGQKNTAWLRVPDPNYPDSRRFIRNDLLITVQADVHTIQSRLNDTKRRDKTFSLGAHFILTDYAIPDKRFSDYQVRFGPNKYVRCNPVTFSGVCPF